jgi:regulatory protein
MPVITAIEPQKNDPERVSVFLDGVFAFGTSRMIAVARKLHTGRELRQDEIETLRHDDEIERALNAALNYLSYRPRSQREIVDYFRQKGTDAELVPAVVQRLERMGLIDDREFAKFWVQNRQTFRPRGTRALRSEMRQKGLETEIIEEALEEIDDEEPIAYAVAQKKLRSLQSLDSREFVRRMVAFLQRRGFPYSVCARVAKRVLDERGAREPGDMPSLDPE